MIPLQNSVHLNTTYLRYMYNIWLIWQPFMLYYTDCRRMMAKPPISSQPKFISQSQIHIPLNCLKGLVLCKNKGWLMELETHNDKICAESSTEYTPTIPYNLFGPFVQIGQLFEKKPHHVSTVCTHLLPTILKICMGPHFITKCTKIEKKSPLLISLIHK